MEASKEKRVSYLELIKDIVPEKLVYIDEGGIDVTEVKDRGWSKKGAKLIVRRSGKYYQRTNIVAGYVNKRSIAPMIFNGSCNTKLFETWIGQFLTKELKEGQFVVMDNATFHRSQKTRELIESVGCKLIFLPPYSPDLNPIEKFWANMKRWIKDKIEDTAQLYETIKLFFLIT